jgi:hypothetical protein
MQFVKALLLGPMLVLVVSTAINAQQAINSSAGAIVPRPVSFSGKALDAADKPEGALRTSHSTIASRHYAGTTRKSASLTTQTT